MCLMGAQKSNTTRTPNPNSVYGASKRKGEEHILKTIKLKASFLEPLGFIQVMETTLSKR